MADLHDDSISDGPEYDDSQSGHLTAGRQCLGLDKSYVSAWTLQDAFRELVQNWKDAILESSGLGSREFKVSKEKDAKNERIYTVRHPHQNETNGKSKLLGFLRYDKRNGNFCLANLNATLSRDALGLGFSTKRNDENLAGTHGEGFKLAALVMLRNDLSVKFDTSEFHWTFNFGGWAKTNLYCCLRPMKASLLSRLKVAYEETVLAGAPRQIRSNIWEDFSVIVTKKRGSNRAQISLADFEQLLDVSLDFQKPSDVLESPDGDLILDSAFSNRIYLKGLRLPSKNHAAKAYVYGYNFFPGSVSRDRERLASPSEEATLIAKIWSSAIAKHRGDILEKYVELLMSHPIHADVTMAETAISLSTADLIWQNLAEKAQNKLFYYPQDSEDEDVDLIKDCLKRDPCKIPTTLWKLLRRHDFVRTTVEEIEQQFKNSQISGLEHTPYAKNVRRALEAAFGLDMRTADLELAFVSYDNANIDLLLSQNVTGLTSERKSTRKPKALSDGRGGCVRIHEKWLGFQTCHAEVSCDLVNLIKFEPDDFVCSHVIEYLYNLVLKKINKHKDMYPTTSTIDCMSLRQILQDKLRQMPRMIRMSSYQVGAIKVSWTDNESRLVSAKYGKEIIFLVILHSEDTCAREKKHLLFQKLENNEGRMIIDNDCDNSPNVRCACPSKLVCQDISQATFTGLEKDKTYFPAVSRTSDQSFYGPIPNAMAPHGKHKVVRPEFVEEKDARSDASYSTTLHNLPYHQHEADNSDEDITVNTRSRNINLQSVLTAPQRSQVAEDLDVKFTKTSDAGWNEWDKTKIDEIFDCFVQSSPPRRRQSNTFSIGSLRCRRLGLKFKRNTFFKVRAKNSREEDFVVFVYDIFVHLLDDESKTYDLQVTRFSYLNKSLLWTTASSSDSEVNNVDAKELVLHFSDFCHMGQQQDSENLNIDNINAATEFDPPEMLGGVLAYTKLKPSALKHDVKLYCRFATQYSKDSNEYNITPVASHLLQQELHFDRHAQFKYPCQPAVLELSPGVLGMSEGFMLEGYDIASALNFNPAHHMSYKARYPNVEVFDASLTSLWYECDNDGLLPPKRPSPGIPRIAVVTGANKRFIPHAEGNQVSELSSFSEPLSVAKEVTLYCSNSKAALYTDFLVLAMPGAVLHEQMIGRFTEVIRGLLDDHYAVFIKKVSLAAHRIPQDRTMIVVVAAPPCAGVHWDVTLLPDGDASPVVQKRKLDDVIGDLSYLNPRVYSKQDSGFMSAHGSFSNLRSLPPYDLFGNTFNHRTGRKLKDMTVVDMEAETIKLDIPSLRRFQHPERGDHLTVRELARIQCLPDDFIFYASEAEQLVQVLDAFPPPIAQGIAVFIKGIIAACREVPAGNDSDTEVEIESRGTKRSRSQRGSSERSSSYRPIHRRC